MFYSLASGMQNRQIVLIPKPDKDYYKINETFPSILK